MTGAHRATLAILAVLGLLCSTPAVAVGVLPLSGSQQFDKDASPPSYLTGGSLFIYNAGTTTPAAVYSDSALTVPLAFPITLNTAGRIPPVYGADGLSVRVRLLSSTSVLQFDDDAIPLVVAPVGSSPTVITLQQLWTTGDIKTRYDDQPADGFVRCNGRTIGSATSGSTERANSDTEPLFRLLWPFANISVVTGKGASASADWSANKQLTLPDCAGRLLGARDDLGGGAKNRITAATITGPTVVGAAGGVETVTLDTTMIPSHTHPSPAVNDPGHQHDYFAATVNGGGGLAAGTGSSGPSTATTSSTTGITLNANTGSTGGGLAHNNMPPVMLFTIYLKL